MLPHETNKHETPGEDGSSPGRPEHVVTGKLGGLTSLAECSLASGADIQADANTIHDDALLVHICAKIAARAPLGETHIISERLGLATDITLTGHGQLPSKTFSYRNDSGIQYWLGRRRAEFTL